MKTSEETKFISIISIPSFSEETTKQAMSIFLSYKKAEVIIEGDFDSTRWRVTDEYARMVLDFEIDSNDFNLSIGVPLNTFVLYLKTYVLCQLGNLVLGTLQSIVGDVKKIVKYKMNQLSKISKNDSLTFINRLSEFFSLIPCGDHEKELLSIIEHLEDLDEKNRASNTNNQRELASFDSYFLFSDILDQFWKESTEKEEKLFFFPLWFWWHISAIIPSRPREIVLTPRNCLSKTKDEWYLTLRKNKIKGFSKGKSYKIDADYEKVKYQIPERLAKVIKWYLDETKGCQRNELNTLFVTDVHYTMWQRCTPYTSRYFTYINLSTCLRYFYEIIVKGRYGYEITYERGKHYLPENQIQYLNLGDTRHLSMINIIAEGATPMVAMLLAGHDNPNISAHYYSNITNLIECRTYRQYKRLIGAHKEYEISKPINMMNVSSSIKIGNGWCYSAKVANGDFSDCINVLGTQGQLGECRKCHYYRTAERTFANSSEVYKERILMECHNVDEMVKKVRKDKGCKEEIIQAIMRLRHEEYSYQQYLQETMEDNDGQKQSNNR